MRALLAFVAVSLIPLSSAPGYAHDPIYDPPCPADYRQPDLLDPYHQLHAIHYQLYRQRAVPCYPAPIIVQSLPVVTTRERPRAIRRGFHHRKGR